MLCQLTDQREKEEIAMKSANSVSMAREGDSARDNMNQLTDQRSTRLPNSADQSSDSTSPLRDHHAAINQRLSHPINQSITIHLQDDIIPLATHSGDGPLPTTSSQQEKLPFTETERQLMRDLRHALTLVDFLGYKFQIQSEAGEWSDNPSSWRLARGYPVQENDQIRWMDQERLVIQDDSSNYSANS